MKVSYRIMFITENHKIGNKPGTTESNIYVVDQKSQNGPYQGFLKLIQNKLM